MSAASDDAPPWQAQACESLKAHAPDCIALMRALYNAGMIEGLRALTYVRTPDGEWGDDPIVPSPVMGEGEGGGKLTPGPSRAYNPPFAPPTGDHKHGR